MSGYDSDREDIENGMGNMNMENDTDKIRRMDRERERKRKMQQRRMQQRRETQRETQGSEKPRDRQRGFDNEMGKVTGMGPSALLRNNEPERDAGYQPPSMIEFVLGRNRRQRRQDEGPDDNKRPDGETPDANPQTDGLIVNNLKF